MANGYSPLLIGIDCLKIAFIDDLEWEKVDNIFLSNLIKLNKFKKGELGQDQVEKDLHIRHCYTILESLPINLKIESEIIPIKITKDHFQKKL